MGEDLGGEWAPIKQAATHLGVSVDTVRRRIQRGELASRREDTPQGYRWLVRIDRKPEPVRVDVDADDDAPGSPRTNATTPHGPPFGSDSRDLLIATLRDALEHRSREISELHEIIGVQARALESTAALNALPQRASLAESVPAEPEQREEPAPVAVIAAPSPGLWERLKRLFTAGNESGRT